MPLETKDVLEFLGADPAKVDSIDKLRETFDSSFIKRDPVIIKSDKDLYGAVIGNTNGSVNTAVRRAAKEAGVELSEDDLKGKSAHEMVDYALPKITGGLAAKLKIAEEQAAKGNDKKLTELQTAFDSYKTEVAPKLTGFDTLKGEYETFKQSVEQEKVTSKITSYKNDAWKGFTWASGISEFAKKGFQAEIESKYKLEVDDSGNVITKNSKGELIQNTKKAGTYKSFAELLLEEGQAANAKGERIYGEAGKQNQPQGQVRTFTVQKENKGGTTTTPLADVRRQPNTSIRSRIQV